MKIWAPEVEIVYRSTEKNLDSALQEPIGRGERRLFRHLRLFHQQYGNAVAHRVYAPAAGALERFFICRKGQWFPAFRNGADQDIQQLLQHHKAIVRVRKGTSPGEALVYAFLRNVD